MKGGKHGEMQGPAHWEQQPFMPVKRTYGPSGSQSNHKDKQCALATEAKGIQGCTGRAVTSKLREVILPMFSALGKSRVLVPSIRQIWRYWKVQQRATKMIKFLEHLSWKETQGDTLSLEQKRLR